MHDSGQSRLWAKQTLDLSDVAQCHTPDLTSCESIAQMADSVLSQAPEEFSLAGFSMGGCVALEIVARAPERVRRLVLLSSNAEGLMPNVRNYYQESIAKLQSGGLATYLADAFPRYVATERVRDVFLWQTFAQWGQTWSLRSP
jgi:pimeloyl-ACP methyl ester carboxylesterase